ncbi:hypothetical protein BDV93DRAFT_40465 [Ceratobasidium sp. AG-I]|nr:hypothetical protein BDV93DRAFT_40465 [Ceratobasidium sp. AG-I]
MSVFLVKLLPILLTHGARQVGSRTQSTLGVPSFPVTFLGDREWTGAHPRASPLSVRTCRGDLGWAVPFLPVSDHRLPHTCRRFLQNLPMVDQNMVPLGLFPKATVKMGSNNGCFTIHIFRIKQQVLALAIGTIWERRRVLSTLLPGLSV